MSPLRLKESSWDLYPPPKYLFRVSQGLPEIDKKGFFQPHKKKNGYGKNVPLIHARQVNDIARIIAGPYGLEKKGVKFFTILAFLNSSLKNRSKARIAIHNEELYQEYFATLNIGSLAFAYIYNWVDLENGSRIHKLADFTPAKLEDVLRSGKTPEEVWDELMKSNLPSSVRVSS